MSIFVFQAVNHQLLAKKLQVCEIGVPSFPLAPDCRPDFCFILETHPFLSLPFAASCNRLKARITDLNEQGIVPKLFIVGRKGVQALTTRMQQERARWEMRGTKCFGMQWVFRIFSVIQGHSTLTSLTSA